MVTAAQKATIDTHTQKKSRNANTTIKIVIKSQEKRSKEEEKKSYKSKPKTMNKLEIEHTYQ